MLAAILFIPFIKENKARFEHCITASGSGFHQLLAASKKRRKSPNLQGA
jgi:hypothetical protein